MTPTGFEGNIACFTGFSSHYDEVRPAPPDALAPLLCAMTRVARPGLVVDLGSGTGLSTCHWSEKAERVIGVEPTQSMTRSEGRGNRIGRTARSKPARTRQRGEALALELPGVIGSGAGQLNRAAA